METTPLKSEHANLILQISKEWGDAEYCMKFGESISGQIVVPSIAELRYAGRKIVQSLAKIVDGNPEDPAILIDLRDALGNVVRAKYDAIDVLVQFTSRIVRDAHSRHSSRELEQGIAGYKAHMKFLQETVRIVSQTRANIDTRREFYEKFSPDRLSALQEIINDFSWYSADAEARRGRDRSSFLRWKIRSVQQAAKGSAQAAVALYAGIISAIAGLLLALLRVL